MKRSAYLCSLLMLLAGLAFATIVLFAVGFTLSCAWWVIKAGWSVLG